MKNRFRLSCLLALGVTLFAICFLVPSAGIIAVRLTWLTLELIPLVLACGFLYAGWEAVAEGNELAIAAWLTPFGQGLWLTIAGLLWLTDWTGRLIKLIGGFTSPSIFEALGVK